MKTLFNRKSDSQVITKIEQLSKSEMKELHGGARMVSIIDKDGHVRVVILP